MACHFSGTSESPLAEPWFAIILSSRFSLQNPSDFAMSINVSSTYGRRSPSITFLYHIRENSGSQPPDVSVIMLKVPVGATVVIYAFLSLFPSLSYTDPSQFGNTPLCCASLEDSSCPVSLINFITFLAVFIPSTES